MNMRNSFKTTGIILGCFFGLAFATNAMANCEDMGNSEWKSLSSEMAAQYDAGNYEEALNTGKRLNLICPRSPIVNYMMSEIYSKLGNEVDAALYAKRSTDYILDYQVPQNVNEKIWLRRAEYELPYKKEAESLRLQMADYDQLKAENEALRQDSNTRLNAVESQAKEDRMKSASLSQKTKNRWNAALWSGVGVTVAGIAVAAGGGAMTNNADKVSYSRSTDPDKSGFTITNKYVAGWVMVGAGSAFAVAGAILTSIAAYKVATIEVIDDAQNSNDISLNISPNSVQFGMTF